MEYILFCAIIFLIGVAGITFKFAMDLKAIANAEIVHRSEIESKLWRATNEAHNWEWIAECLRRDLEDCRKSTTTLKYKNGMWAAEPIDEFVK